MKKQTVKIVRQKNRIVRHKDIGERERKIEREKKGRERDREREISTCRGVFESFDPQMGRTL